MLFLLERVIQISNLEFGGGGGVNQSIHEVVLGVVVQWIHEGVKLALGGFA
jgi:hypothetical protein